MFNLLTRWMNNVVVCELCQRHKSCPIDLMIVEYTLQHLVDMFNVCINLGMKGTWTMGFLPWAFQNDILKN
jgi:hypothetical protein